MSEGLRILTSARYYLGRVTSKWNDAAYIDAVRILWDAARELYEYA